MLVAERFPPARNIVPIARWIRRRTLKRIRVAEIAPARSCAVQPRAVPLQRRRRSGIREPWQPFVPLLLAENGAARPAAARLRLRRCLWIHGPQSFSGRFLPG